MGRVVVVVVVVLLLLVQSLVHFEHFQPDLAETLENDILGHIY